MKQAFIIAIACLLVLNCLASGIESEWAQYKLKHGKKYSKVEDEFRFKLFKQKLEHIEKHNKRYEAGEVSYYLGLNKMSDLTPEEKKRFRTSHVQKSSNKQVYEFKGINIPESVDWRTQGAVNPVRDQDLCGSCFAFSAIASIEGQFFRKNGTLVSFSEQQLVDCDSNSNGCMGGSVDNAFQYLQSNGLELASDYPFVAEKHTCKHSAAKSVLPNITTFVDLPTGDENALQEAIANIGPISVAIAATTYDFEDYVGGIYDNPYCATSFEWLNHFVTVVGYGTHEGKAYYIVRNSWGENWGLQGYILMSRNRNNQCGIATSASYPVL